MVVSSETIAPTCVVQSCKRLGKLVLFFPNFSIQRGRTFFLVLTAILEVHVTPPSVLFFQPWWQPTVRVQRAPRTCPPIEKYVFTWCFSLSLEGYKSEMRFGLHRCMLKGKRCLPGKAGRVLSALGDVPPSHKQCKNRHQMNSDRHFLGTLFETLGLKNVTVFWPQNLRHF